MSLHAIFKFENIDSTRDLNDRFKDLFAKGIYQGGKLAINSYGTVVISPFKAMSYDGMAVLSDEPMALSIPLTGAFYIVLKAKYDYNNPVLEITYLDSTSSLVDDDEYIRFGKIVDGKEIDYSVLSRDTLDKLGRNPFKGIYYDDNKPEETIEGDMWFVINEGYCEIKVQSGANPSDVTTFTSATAIEDRLARHIENQLRSSEGVTEAWDGDWGNTGCVNSGDNIRVYNAAKQYNYENVPPNITEPDMFGSYHVSINKWFATENIGRTWDLSSGVPNKGTPADFETDSTKRKFSEIKNIINAHDTRANSGDASPISVQLPSNDNKFITQNYPVLPTYDEKTALSGNILDTNDDAPSYDNRFLVQQTIGFKINKCSAIRVVTSEADKYCYKIVVSAAVDSNAHLYLPGITDGSSDVDASRYFSFTIKSEAYGVPTFLCVKKNEHASGVTPSTITLSTLSQIDYMTTPSKFNGKSLLKSMSGTNVVDYYLVSSVELVGDICFYTSCRIEDNTPAQFNNTTESYGSFESIGIRSGNIYVNDTLQVIKNANSSTSNTDILKVSYDTGTVLRYYGNSLVLNDGSRSVLDLSYNNGTVVKYAGDALLIKYGDNNAENALRISLESSKTNVRYYGSSLILNDGTNDALKVRYLNGTDIRYYGGLVINASDGTRVATIGYDSASIITYNTKLTLNYDDSHSVLGVSYSSGTVLQYAGDSLLIKYGSESSNNALRISLVDSETNIRYYGGALLLKDTSNNNAAELRYNNGTSFRYYGDGLLITTEAGTTALKIAYSSGSTVVYYNTALMIKYNDTSYALRVDYDSSNGTILAYYGQALRIYNRTDTHIVSVAYYNSASEVSYNTKLTISDGTNTALQISYSSSSSRLTFTNSLFFKSFTGITTTNALKISGTSDTQLQYYGSWLTFNNGSADILKVGYSSGTVIAFTTSMHIKSESYEPLVISYDSTKGTCLTYSSRVLLTDGTNNVLSTDYYQGSNVTYYGNYLIVTSSTVSNYTLGISYNSGTVIAYRTGFVLNDAQNNNVITINSVGSYTNLKYNSSLQITTLDTNENVLKISYNSSSSHSVLTHRTGGLYINNGTAGILFKYDSGSVMQCSGALAITDGVSGHGTFTIGAGQSTLLTYNTSLLSIRASTGAQMLNISEGTSVTNSDITYTVGGKTYYVLLSDTDNGGIKYIQKDISLSGNDSTALYFA